MNLSLRAKAGRRSFSHGAFAGLVLLVLAGCGSVFQGGDGITYLYEETPIYEEEPFLASSRGWFSGRGRQVENFDYTIVRVAQVDPVVVGASTTQANEIVISGTTAVIAYNTAGPVFNGALQILNIQNPTRPVITAEIAFPDVDIVSIELDGNTLYFAGSLNPDPLPEPFERSFVAQLDLTDLSSPSLADDAIAEAIIFGAPDPGITTLPGVTTDRPYFFATSLGRSGGTIYVGVGADPGGLYSVDPALSGPPTAVLDWDSDLYDNAAFEASGTLDPTPDGTPDGFVVDIRDIDQYLGGPIVLAGTNDPFTDTSPSNGRLLVFRNEVLSDVEVIPDFGSAESKASIEVYSFRYAFVGASQAGFKVYYLWDRGTDILESVYSIDNPLVGWTDETDTNSVTFSGDLVFTANGEAGFRVFRAERLSFFSRPEPGWMEQIGFVSFDGTQQPSGDFWSANHVEYRDETLFVASGLGGVNIYSLVRQ